MRLPFDPRRLAVARLAALATVGAPLFALLWCMTHNPRASPLSYFLSELAVRRGGEFLSPSFMVAGASVILCCVFWFWHLNESGGERAGCVLGVLAGTAIVVAGAEPITGNLDVHNTAAVVAAMTTPGASWCLARATRRRLAHGGRRWLAHTAMAAAYVQLVSVGAAVAFVVTIVATLPRVTLPSVARATRITLASGAHVRPLATAEWMLFGAAGLLLLGSVLFSRVAISRGVRGEVLSEREQQGGAWASSPSSV